MTDETASAEGLVTAETTTSPPPPPIEQTHTIVDPAATIDPAAKLDPAKAAAKPKRRRTRAKTPTKKATAKRDAAQTAEAVKRMAAGKAAKADRASRTAHDDEARTAYEAAKLHPAATFADLPEGDALHIRFANGQEFVTDGVEVPLEDLAVWGGRATYSKPCDFAPEASPSFVKEALLIAESGAAVVCEVGVGLSVGGGKHGLIPAGHLRF